jgi:hypothetical protein
MKEGVVERMLSTRLARLEALVTIAALSGLAGAGLTRTPARAQGTPPVSEPVWEVIGSITDFTLAPGMTMELARFTWMPGYEQKLHTHNAADVVYVL